MKKILAVLAGAALAVSLSGCITVQAPAEVDTAQQEATPAPSLLPAEPEEQGIDPDLYQAALEATVAIQAPELCALLDTGEARMLSGTEIYEIYKAGFMRPESAIEGLDMAQVAYDSWNMSISGYCPEWTSKMVGAK